MLQDPQQSPPPHQLELLAMLRQAAIFGRCTDEQLQALARRTHLLRLDAGEILFQQGDRARMVYLLLRVLKQLNAKGIISLAGGNIVRVPERHRLQRFVEQSGKS
jgi:hypothetical protein